MNQQGKEILKSSIRSTFCFCIAGSILALLLWPSNEKPFAAAGVFWGAILAEIGLLMIISMASSLSPDASRAKRKARLGYMGRYFFYAAGLAAGALLHLPALSMLAGFLLQKASLMLYAYRNGKEVE